MKYNISIASVAEIDIQEISKEYNKKQDDLGVEFEQEIDKYVEYLKRDAQTIQVRYSNIRVCFLTRFPYGIHFQLTKNKVLIIAIYAMKESTSKWVK